MNLPFDAVVQDDHAGGQDDDGQSDCCFGSEGLGECPDADEHGGYGFQDAQDGTHSGADQFDGLDQGDVGDCSGRNGDAQNVQPQVFFAEGNPRNTTRKLTRDDEGDGRKSHYIAGERGGLYLFQGFATQADDVDGVSDHGKNGVNQPSDQVAAFQVNASRGKQNGSDNGEKDGANLDA